MNTKCTPKNTNKQTKTKIRLTQTIHGHFITITQVRKVICLEFTRFRKMYAGVQKIQDFKVVT